MKGFLQLESQGKLGPNGATYLVTGNALNDKSLLGSFTLGIGKATAAYMVEYLALRAYNDKPFRFVSSFATMGSLTTLTEMRSSHAFSFYYVDERKPDGSPMRGG